MNPFHLTRRELYNLDGTPYGSFYEREGDRKGWVRLTSLPGVEAVDDQGRSLVEWRGRVFRCAL